MAGKLTWCPKCRAARRGQKVLVAAVDGCDGVAVEIDHREWALFPPEPSRITPAGRIYLQEITRADRAALEREKRGE